MEITWRRFYRLREKKSVGGWILWVLLLLWNAIGHWQNFTWLRGHVSMLHLSLISWLLGVGGLVWIAAILLWPDDSNHPWLQFDNGQLRIQNTTKYPIFDVVVKIGERAFLESDVIPRIEGNSWQVCKKQDQPISRNTISETRVDDILSEGPQEITPAVITYRDKRGAQCKSQLDIKSVGAGPQFFLPERKNE